MSSSTVTEPSLSVSAGRKYEVQIDFMQARKCSDWAGLRMPIATSLLDQVSKSSSSILPFLSMSKRVKRVAIKV